MQLRFTDIDTGKVLKALADLRFGIVRIDNPARGYADTPAVLETAAVWTEDGPGDSPETLAPQGFEIGILRRELSNFTRHELVLDTNRIPHERLMALLDRIATENR